MAKGDNINNPNLELTPTLGADGKLIHRYMDVNSEAALDTPLVSDAESDAVRATSIVDRFDPADGEEYRTGTDAEFGSWYERDESPSGDVEWQDHEIAGIDPNRVWRITTGDTGGKVISPNNLIPGNPRVNHVAFAITKEPWTSDSEQYWDGDSPEEWASEFVEQAIDRDLDDESRAYAAINALEGTDFEWDGYSELNADEYLEFDELLEDEAKVIAAIDALLDAGLTADEPLRFGAKLAERLWADHQEAIVNQIADDEDEYDEEKTDLARKAAAEITDINLLANFVTTDTEDFMVLGALENPIATPAIVDRAARHASPDVRRAAILHPLSAKKTLLRIRAESVNNAEVLDGYNAPSVVVPEFMKSIHRQQASVQRDLVAVVDQVLAHRRREAGE